MIVTCNIEVLDNKSRDKLGQVNASCLYYVENFEQYFNKEKNALNLPQGVITMLNSISISTTRGVMYGVFRGTFLNGAILPVVNPNMQIKE